jgi:hypothetical protein
MDGYIVKDVTCKKNLRKDLVWYNHEKIYGESPYVFSKEVIDYIRQICGAWITKPAYMVKARWTEENGVEVLGNLEAFWPVNE